MKKVFEYIDYRIYLEDYYNLKKATNLNYSYKIFAEKAGFSDKSCIYSVIKGNRNLNTAGIFSISRTLKHTRHEAEYFEALVSFNQAKSNDEKTFYFNKLCQIKTRGRGAGTNSSQILRKDQYDFYSKWYHVMIRSLIGMYNFSGDYEWIAGMLSPKITSKQAKHSVELLEKLGLITKGADGVYTISDTEISTGKEVLSIAVTNFHKECFDLACRALNELSSESRNISALTIGISMNSYQKIVGELQSFQKRIIEIANKDDEADQVFQFNFQLFPTSNSQ